MNKFKIVAALATGLVLQSAAFAGANTTTQTTVGSIYGYGAFHDARNNSGSTERLSCYLGAYVSTYTSSTTSNYVQCSATAANGASYYCYTYNPSSAWISLVTSMNESSWVYFYGDSSHHCLGINLEQGSNYL
jgi:hypothetical protein